MPYRFISIYKNNSCKKTLVQLILGVSCAKVYQSWTYLFKQTDYKSSYMLVK